MELFSILVNAAESKPKVRYLVAVDDSHSTLEEVVRVSLTTSITFYDLDQIHLFYPGCQHKPGY